MDYRIFPPEEILEATVTLPQSKSVAMRALLLNYLSGRKGDNAMCDDTATLSQILNAGLPSDGSAIEVGASGAACRFLTALCAASEGVDCVITGSARMLKRPIGPLVLALKALGADIEFVGEEGFPPLRIKGRKLSGGSVEIDASESSQYVSALMMIAPLLDSKLEIKLTGNQQSAPYIRMTGEMMSQRGAIVEIDRDKVELTCSRAIEYAEECEADWSAAAFWYEIAAVTAGWLTLDGLSDKSLQGDRQSTALFERLGVITEFTEAGAELSATPDLYNSLDADLSDMPDVVPALVVTCCLIGLPFRLSGIGALHHKESDRVEALIAEMAKLGCELETEAYGTTLIWDGRRVPITSMPVFETYGDHRLAMSLAPVAVYVPGIVVKDVEVVTKSYPTYWEQLQQAGFRVVDAAAIDEKA